MYSCFLQILYSFSLPCGATVMNIYKGIIYIYKEGEHSSN